MATAASGCCWATATAPSRGSTTSASAAPPRGTSRAARSTAAESGAASVLLGNGDGTFQAARNYAGTSAFVGDFNGDGSLDLVVGARLLPGNGHDVGAFPVGSGPVAVGDFNGDGLWDVAET